MNLETVKRRFQMMVSTCLVKHVTDDPPDVDGRPALQELQIAQLDGELRDKRENYQPYGFAHYPLPEAEPISLSENGDRAHTILICVADRWHRLKLEEAGEVAIYDDQGQYVWIKRDGIEINTDKDVKIKASKVTIEAAAVELKGAVKINGIIQTGN